MSEGKLFLRSNENILLHRSHVERNAPNTTTLNTSHYNTGSLSFKAGPSVRIAEKIFYNSYYLREGGNPHLLVSHQSHCKVPYRRNLKVALKVGRIRESQQRGCERAFKLTP